MFKKPIIFLGSDHRGFTLKNDLFRSLKKLEYEVVDCGPTELKNSYDYSDYAFKVVNNILDLDEQSIGILVCNSGTGMCIAANRHIGIRAALCHDAEHASLARKHNDANIICLGASKTNLLQALEIIDIFLNTAFEKGRHSVRVEKLDNFCEINK